MKQQTYGTLKGLKVPVMVYESYDEADKAAGKANAMLEVGNDNLHYRGGTASATREYICNLLQELPESKGKKDKAGHPLDNFIMVAVAGKTTKDANGKEVPLMRADESEGEFVNRVCSFYGWDDLSKFQSQLTSWAASAYNEVDDKGTMIGKPIPLAVDAKEPERKPKAPPKLSEEDKMLAGELLDGKKSLKKFNEAAGKFGIVAFSPTKDRNADIQSLGWSIRAWFKAKQEAARNAAKMELS